MSEERPTTNWPWLVAGGMFDLKSPISVVQGYARMLEIEKLGAVTTKQRDALQSLQRAACDISETVQALAGLASMEGAWPGIATVRIPLGKLLTDVAGLPFLERGRPIDIRVNDQHDEVIGAGRLLQRALAGLARSVIWDQFKSERPLSIWVVEPLVPTERWIVLAATDQIQEAVETPRERLSPLDDRPSRISMDLPFAGAIVRAHGGQLLALPEGTPGAVVALPRPAGASD